MKLHQRIFQLFVLLIPVQLGLHFWPFWAFVSGIRVDYLSPTIYLTDLVFWSGFAAWVLKDRPRLGKYKFFFFGLGILATINTMFAFQPFLALFRWIKVLEFLALSFYVFSNKKTLLKLINTPLSLAIIYTFFIAILQVFLQRTVGGFLYLLGERSFAASTPGISLVNFFGRAIMRPYGTFPHPNAMAGFVLVSVFLLLTFRSKSLINRVAIVLGAVTIFLSFSQNAWVAFFIMLVLPILRGKKRWGSVKKIIFLLTLTFSLILPVISQLLVSDRLILFFDLSIKRRLVLSEIAGIIFSRYPVFGVGLGGFIPTIAEVLTSHDFLVTETIWWLQPVHNIYLLVLAEAGIVGFLLFSFALYKILLNTKSRLDIGLILILFTGILDHYWLTLQQPFLLFAILVGFLIGKDLLKYKS